MTHSIGDWVVFDLKIGQIKELYTENPSMGSFTDGVTTTSGHIVQRWRPLTLRSKVITEDFRTLYNKLYLIDGNAGFNYPDISAHFWRVALDTIDADLAAYTRDAYERMQNFVDLAEQYSPVIQGVQLFRPRTRWHSKP